MKKNIIFDFDGTMVDTLDLALAFGNANQHRFSKTKIVKEEFRQRSMREALSHIGLPWYKLPQFVLELKSYLKMHLNTAPIFSGISDLIAELKHQGFGLYVLSSNSRENIEGVLIRTNLLSHFNDIVSDSSIFGKHVILERLFKTHDLSKTDSVYVGDEVRDAEACAKCDIPMIAVSWGWDNFERLRKVPDLTIAQSVEELRSLLAKQS